MIFYSRLKNEVINVLFDNYELKDYIVKALMDLKFNEFTDVQKKVFEKLKTSKNILAKSRTGSGKTHSFLVPIFNDLDEDDAIEELLRFNVIEDSEDYFGLDEDGDIDHSIPKFDYQYYGDVYAEKYIENINDVIDEFISNFGYDGIENYIKYDRLAKLIVEADGPESTIASYDGVEREETVDGQTYYIYRVN